MDSRIIKIKIFGEAEEQYNKFHATVLEEQNRGLTNSFSLQLKKAIDREIENLRVDPQKGIHIPKRNISKKLFEKYRANNFWKIDLPHGWRMVYTITGNRAEIIIFILAIVDHNEYNKMFGYRKN